MVGSVVPDFSTPPVLHRLGDVAHVRLLRQRSEPHEVGKPEQWNRSPDRGEGSSGRFEVRRRRSSSPPPSGWSARRGVPVGTTGSLPRRHRRTAATRRSGRPASIVVPLGTRPHLGIPGAPPGRPGGKSRSLLFPPRIRARNGWTRGKPRSTRTCQREPRSLARRRELLLEFRSRRISARSPSQSPEPASARMRPARILRTNSSSARPTALE